METLFKFKQHPVWDIDRPHYWLNHGLSRIRPCPGRPVWTGKIPFAIEINAETTLRRP